MRQASRIIVALAAVSTVGCSGDELEGAKAEVTDTQVKLDMPAVPEFAPPKTYSDGTHSVAEMRLVGGTFLNTDVKVRGYVVWVYDCAKEIRTAEMDEKQIQEILEKEPERCSRPSFRLGDTPGTPSDKGAWVVDVPRPPRKDELKVLAKEVLANWPAVPEFDIGDEVVVTGKWSLLSPSGFADSTGLLVYGDKGALENITKAATNPPE